MRGALADGLAVGNQLVASSAFFPAAAAPGCPMQMDFVYLEQHAAEVFSYEFLKQENVPLFAMEHAEQRIGGLTA